jgi:hypothetical protein
MDRRRLGSRGLEVSAEGLGCMGMTWAYGAGEKASGLATIHRALDLGVGDDPPGVKLTAQDIEELDNAVSREGCTPIAIRSR